MATKSKSTPETDSTGEPLNGFAGFAGANGPTLEALQNGMERAVEMNKENVDAFVESMTATTKGLEVLSGETLSFAKLLLEESVKASKAMMAVKSPQEFMTLHNEYTRSIFDQLVNQATKVNDLSKTAMKSALAPINDRVTTMSKAFNKARAF